MTDITELAQSLKAAAENAIGAHERLAAYPYGEIIDISQHEGEQIDIDITDINEFHEEANPVNVLALVEALDKAQQQMTESENRVRKQNRHICELFDDNTALRQRIAELESRTVTVKMPKPHAHLIWIQAGHAPDDYWDDVAVSHSEKDRCCDGSERYPVYARWEIEGMLTAAGIKWEAE
ncbi:MULTISPECIES: ead/Ea22-like family protein [Klebsiella pneumoniae complex]|uniref:ead/Ea22-like family protein n=1 Tax=Klebsiella pneumoniae complex TaxID=3390273 RepID=UPI001CBFD7F9|nr:ead/Ea22-like family protein [Klebsiella pneumoniae]